MSGAGLDIAHRWAIRPVLFPNVSVYSLEVVASFGRRGRWAGQFESPHSLAIDSQGNLFVGETLDGRRVQKFVPAP